MMNHSTAADKLGAFEDIPDDWVCPLCGASKDDFELVED